jgi:hypothetical protein
MGDKLCSTSCGDLKWWKVSILRVCCFKPQEECMRWSAPVQKQTKLVVSGCFESNDEYLNNSLGLLEKCWSVRAAVGCWLIGDHGHNRSRPASLLIRAQAA